MVRFKEDRYTILLGVIETITDTGNLWVLVCGGGAMGHRMVLPEKCEKVSKLD
jgi:hypothetical protein